VRFVFAWPDEAEVDVVATRSLAHSLRRSTFRAEARFSFRISRSGATTTLSSQGLVVAPIREQLQEDTVHSSFVAAMFLPSVTLDRDAELVDLLDPSSSQNEIDVALERAVPEATRRGQLWQRASMMWAGTSALERNARELLRTIVSGLPGRTWPIGTTFRSTTSAAVDGSGVAVPHEATARLEAEVPCRAGERSDGCVRLVTHAVPDPAVLAQIGAAVGAQRMTVSRDATLITEPQTLLPHRCEIRSRRTYSAAITGTVRDIEEVETRTWVFTYRQQRRR
jgi:hypothetical protein